MNNNAFIVIMKETEIKVIIQNKIQKNKLK